MNNLHVQMAEYLSGQRATAAQVRGQEEPPVDGPATTVDRIAAAVVERARAQAGAWSQVTILELPKTGEAARAAMVEILANAKQGRRLWHNM